MLKNYNLQVKGWLKKFKKIKKCIDNQKKESII